MAREILTNEQIEAETELLSKSEYVRLARKYNLLKVEKQRKRLYALRNLEKCGKELAAMGITVENIEEIMFSDAEESEG